MDLSCETRLTGSLRTCQISIRGRIGAIITAVQNVYAAIAAHSMLKLAAAPEWQWRSSRCSGQTNERYTNETVCRIPRTNEGCRQVKIERTIGFLSQVQFSAL
jgi:hypothetical protein